MILTGKVQNGPHSVCVSAKLKLASQEKELFTGFGNSDNTVVLEYGRYPANVLDTKNVQVLANITARTTEPLLLKITQGSGTAYLFVSKMFLKPKVILFPHVTVLILGRQENLPELRPFLETKGATQETMAAWQCAFNVGYKNALALAIAAYPSMETISRIIIREYAFVEQLQASRQQQDSQMQQDQSGAMTFE